MPRKSTNHQLESMIANSAHHIKKRPVLLEIRVCERTANLEQLAQGPLANLMVLGCK